MNAIFCNIFIAIYSKPELFFLFQACIAIAKIAFITAMITYSLDLISVVHILACSRRSDSGGATRKEVRRTASDFIHIFIITFIDLLPTCGFIAQLVKHHTSNVEVMGSNPVEGVLNQSTLS